MIHTFTSLHYVTGELYFYSFFFFDESDNSFPLSRLPRFSESFCSTRGGPSVLSTNLPSQLLDSREPGT